MSIPSEDPIIQLYRDSFPDVARMIRRKGGTLEEAKDAFHDALLIYLEKEKAGRLQLHGSPKAYLVGTARICWLRARGATVSLPDAFDAAEPAEGGVEEREQSVRASLVRSGKKCLELLKAFYYDHCSMQDIAGRFGFNGTRSATVQKYKCLEKVRKEIKSNNEYAS
ncbi:RNA polymerase sigma factor [Paraflavitalea pollutisoli]|uniref:RNA polymerase sigma factor n=1 Tax=Paraflavitalea pollutisoli TaxID=3034143 RepID=UPI0023ED40D2|nr:sigma-70 family RNA polymerase sigma factor [Paraflavitalea sp. H1-2-19X]